MGEGKWNSILQGTTAMYISILGSVESAVVEAA
jgi:hypothetical protein